MEEGCGYLKVVKVVTFDTLMQVFIFFEVKNVLKLCNMGYFMVDRVISYCLGMAAP